jgi:hypothetical protein
MDENLLKSAISGISRRGKTELVKYLSGGRLTQRQAIRAKCYECNGMGEQNICDIDSCSLFPYSPYREKQS